jgi:fido (protein-threonine AMPylation protein)
MTTETKLREWRNGPIMSERLCAAILVLQSFNDIDPQAPLGGADDRKDILCSRSEISYVVGVYFPPTHKDYKDVEDKFLHDLEGVARHKRKGFCFFTNQRLTLGERDKLEALGSRVTRDCQIYHLERIRTILDQPTGYGVRLEFLRIELTPEEQFAYFTNSRKDVENLVGNNNRLLRLLNTKVDKLLTDQQFVVQTLALSAEKDGFEVSPPPSRPDLFLGSSYRASPKESGLSSNITIELLLALHRAVSFEIPSNEVGALRNKVVYLSRADQPPSEAVATSPAPAKVPELLQVLCSNWNDDFSKLNKTEAEAKLNAIAKFHAEFLQIHPFTDGNGRVARLVLMQQCLDVFGIAEMGLLDKGAAYYGALLKADNGQLNALIELLKPIAGIES